MNVAYLCEPGKSDWIANGERRRSAHRPTGDIAAFLEYSEGVGPMKLNGQLCRAIAITVVVLVVLVILNCGCIVG